MFNKSGRILIVANHVINRAVIIEMINKMADFFGNEKNAEVKNPHSNRENQDLTIPLSHISYKILNMHLP